MSVYVCEGFGEGCAGAYLSDEKVAQGCTSSVKVRIIVTSVLYINIIVCINEK